MSLSKDVKAAIGQIVVETAWIEYVMATLIARVDRRNIMEVLKEDGSKLAKRAKQAATKLNETEMVVRAESWLKEAEELRTQRNQIIHSIVAKAHPGWTGYYPRGEIFREYKTREIVDLAYRMSRSAAVGENMAHSEWPRPS
jgi:hypothetical protein